jgi:hypothetical protein
MSIPFIWVTFLISEISQSREIAMIDRQFTITKVEGRESMDRV